MRWRGRDRSGNVEDRRRFTPGGIAIGGGLGSVVLVVIFMLMGGDPTQLLNLPGGTQMSAPPETGESDTEFVSVVLKDTEDVWHQLFRDQGISYEEPRLVLFNGEVNSACGQASAAVGPFYCPGDATVYLDLSFFEDLHQRFGAPGDFAAAYVIAHEIGHHVQSLLNISNRVHEQRGRVSDEEYNQLSVRLELQADFLAGVWAHHAQASKQILDPGDVEEALKAASAIGDDRLQMESQGYTTPDSFTHGTSEQRLHWFRRGLETGDLSQGDTFTVDAL